MKKFFSSFIMVGIFLSFGYVNPYINIPAKVSESFNYTFKNVKNPEWAFDKNTYIVSFEQSGIKTRIYYDEDGNFISSLRYYYESNLPLNVLLKIKNKYRGKSICNVTEIIVDSCISYSVNIEDEKEVYIIKSTVDGVLELEKKFKKQN